MHEGRWWQQREGRWWIRNEATHVWKPFGGGGGVEPETVDAWAILEVLKQQTGFLRRIAFWATLFGVVWLIGTAIWVVSIVGIVSEFG
jgi:hypothetical protein